MLAAAALIVALTPATAFAQARVLGSDVRGRMVERDVRVTDVAPEWLAIPAEGRLETSGGVQVAPLQSASVSYENAGLGMLIGAFRNVGRCLRDVSVRFVYVDAQGQAIGAPIENEARVTWIDPDGLLPYRFRLRSRTELERPAAAYVLRLVEGTEPGGGTACPARPYAFEVVKGKSRTTSKSYQVTGTLRIVAGGPIRPDGITLTALLLDEAQQVLEVLTGAPDTTGANLPTGLLEDGLVLPFRLATPVPLGKWVTDVQVFAEVLPDAQVAR